MKSLSEIEITAKRASKAAGFSWGVAEEVAKGIRLLELFGFPGVKNLNQYFKVYKNNNFEDIKIISKLNVSKKFYCPITAGVNFYDQSFTLDSFEKVEIKNLAFPLLFIPFVSRASETIGKRIFLKMDNKEFLFNFNQSIYSNYLSGDVLEKSEKITLNFLKNQDTFNEKEWSELYRLSENTFVEESEELKNNAAGAGLTDND